MNRQTTGSWCQVSLMFVLATLAGAPAFAQIDISGDWAARIDEDQPVRIAGEALGDFTGLPINAAARQKASH